MKSGTGGTRTYTCPAANINLSWSAVCGGAVSSYSASATTTHPAPTPTGGPTTITATCTVPLAVSKTDVAAKVEGNDVELSWKGTNASTIERYEVQKLVKDSFQTVATIQNVNTLTKTFSNLPAGKHTFRVVSFGTDGSTLQSDAIEVEIILPGAFELTNAYPNPFNPMTKFTLTVAKTQNVRVEIYNLQGQLVTTLFNGQVQAKEVNTLNFNAANLPSGTYIYQAMGETFKANKKIVLVK
ncbi:MAG TPA: T9SS type A sorting domain-containing protein [Rhodothermales bacterium]|nr:T9SS type A sorting domain-containing protein [Rhodothermales bacterium]